MKKIATVKTSKKLVLNLLKNMISGPETFSNTFNI